MKSSAVPIPMWLCFLCCVLAHLSQANIEFAFDLQRQLSDKNEGKNLFFSPIGITYGFGMVNLGARGKTQEQLKAVLSLDNLGPDDVLNSIFKQVLDAFNRQSNNYTLLLANRLFGSKAFEFRPQFLQDSLKYFEASSESLDFARQPEESRQYINHWVEEKTNQKIKDLFPANTLDPSTALVIVSAIYFKASWVFPFDSNDTKPGQFSISKTQQVTMDMMHLKGIYLNYYNATDLSCDILELPYQGDRASMFVFLPRDVEGLPKLEKQLNEEKLIEILSKVERRNVEVQLPKFMIEQDISLKKFLQSMGLRDIFDASTSDLSGIGGPGRLTVTEVLHKAFVNVTEAGTEAAAATAIVLAPGGPPNPTPTRFIVDRPFLFLIFEKPTKNVLFIGRLIRPSTQKESIGKFGETAPHLSNAALISASVSGLCSALVLLFVQWRLQ